MRENIPVFNNSNERPYFSRYKNLFVFSTIFILLLSSALILVQQNNAKKTYAFSIDNKKYLKSDIRNLIKLPNSISSGQDNAKQAFTLYENKIAATKLGIVLSQASIDQEVKDLKSLYSSATSKEDMDWINLLAYNNVLTVTLNGADITNNASGYVFYFWANQHVSNYYNGQSSITPPQGTGQQSFIDQDKNYSLARANYYHDQLVAGSLSAEDVSSQITNDIKLSQAYIKDENMSTHFGQSADTSWKYEIQIPSVINYIESISKPGITPVRTEEQFSNGVDEGTYYYFVDLTKISAKQYNSMDLQTEISKMKVVYYGL